MTTQPNILMIVTDQEYAHQPMPQFAYAGGGLAKVRVTSTSMGKIGKGRCPLRNR